MLLDRIDIDALDARTGVSGKDSKDHRPWLIEAWGSGRSSAHVDDGSPRSHALHVDIRCQAHAVRVCDDLEVHFVREGTLCVEAHPHDASRVWVRAATLEGGLTDGEGIGRMRRLTPEPAVEVHRLT